MPRWSSERQFSPRLRRLHRRLDWHPHLHRLRLRLRLRLRRSSTPSSQSHGMRPRPPVQPVRAGAALNRSSKGLSEGCAPRANGM
jgi:hypothetical protein